MSGRRDGSSLGTQRFVHGRLQAGVHIPKVEFVRYVLNMCIFGYIGLDFY